MTTQHFNYGPRMSFDKLQYQRTNSTTVPSEYLDYKSVENSTPHPTNSAFSTSSVSSSSLGPHWRKVASVVRERSPSTTTTTTPSKPSSFSSYTSTSSKSSGTLIDKSSESSSSEMSSHRVRLSETTTCREERQCIFLQTQGLGEMNMAIDRTLRLFTDAADKQIATFNEEIKNADKFWEKTVEYIESMKEQIDDAQQTFDVHSSGLMDTINELGGLFHKKANIESFVRHNEGLIGVTTKTLEMLRDNERRMSNVRTMLDFNRMEQVPLTTFEHEDPRIRTVFRKLVSMLDKLPLTESERADLDTFVAKTKENAQFSCKYKCELIVRQLLAVLSPPPDTAISTAEWPTANKAYSSSSFALSDLTGDSSNLDDLDGSLHTAQVQLAVEGLNRVIECGPWTSASESSFNTDGHTSIQSLNDPMTLSSYELNSSTGQSTLSSMSTQSMPNQTFDYSDDSRAEMEGLDLKTAMSDGGIMQARPARSRISTASSATGHATTLSGSTPSLNFSTVSLGEMVDDALHTAKDVAETQTNNLLKALHESANKCGVAISDLMTAVSSSSEHLSETQSSRSKSISH